MSPLIWIAMPIGATLIATLWALWAARDRGPADVTDSVEAYQRFVETMSKNVKPVDIKSVDVKVVDVKPLNGDR